MPFPKMIWRELLIRLRDQCGVELREFEGGSTGLYRTDDGEHFYFRPGPRFLNNSVTRGEFEDVCRALHIDGNELFSGD